MRFIPRHRMPSIAAVPFRGPRPLALRYRVGEPFVPGRDGWDAGDRLAPVDGGLHLMLFRRQVAPGLVADVQRGPARFALIHQSPLIVLAYQVGDAGAWSEAAFAWPLAVGDRATAPRPAALGGRALLWISLIEADGGLIRAQRGLTLSPSFSRELARAIDAEARAPLDPHACFRALAEMHLHQPDPAARRAQALARTDGNE